jgi:hypothetical protein
LKYIDVSEVHTAFIISLMMYELLFSKWKKDNCRKTLLAYLNRRACDRLQKCAFVTNQVDIEIFGVLSKYD